MADFSLERIGDGQPSGKSSLIDLYGLRDFATSLARQDPHSGAKRKLRKSYKNHVADLPGRHPVPGPGESRGNLLDSVMQPGVPTVSETLKVLDFSPETLGVVRLQKSTVPLPNFDPKLLAAPGVAAEQTKGRSGLSPTAASAANSPRHYSPHGSPMPEERMEKRKRKDAAAAEKRRKF